MPPILRGEVEVTSKNGILLRGVQRTLYEICGLVVNVSAASWATHCRRSFGVFQPSSGQLVIRKRSRSDLAKCTQSSASNARVHSRCKYRIHIVAGHAVSAGNESQFPHGCAPWIQLFGLETLDHISRVHRSCKSEPDFK